MGSPLRDVVGLLGLVGLCFGLAGCGSSAHSSAPSGASAVAKPSPGNVVTAQSRIVSKPQPQLVKLSPARVAQLAHGGAASFRAPRKDNSVPDFGREAHSAERKQAMEALRGFLRARANGEWATACDYLARPQQHILDGIAAHTDGKHADCAAALEGLMTAPAAERADPFDSRGLAALRVKYPTAFALFYGTNGAKYVMPMQDEHGKWKMTQLAPLPYPLGTQEQRVP